MARNEVIRAGHSDRLRILMASDHLAGDFVWEKGFYGWVQDDIDVSENAWGVLWLAGVYELARTPAAVAAGTKLYAPATSQATTLPMTATTTGGNPVGRTTATGGATSARVRLFSDNAY